jgi:hypothetical protein
MAAEHLPYLAHLKRREKSSDGDRLPNEVDAIERMLDSEGWRVLTELVEYVHGEAASRLIFAHTGLDGRVLEQAEYARLLGFLSGLRQARVAAEAFLIHAERVKTKESA